jgi:hypothetical protein
MRAWIEISSEYRFLNKLTGKSGLYAPLMTRYINMLKLIEKGDVVFHYITNSDAINKTNGSSIIGISSAVSSMRKVDTRLTLDIDNIVKLVHPINIKDLKKMETKSERLQNLISQSFQRYIAEIELVDVRNILKIYPKNEQLIKSLNHFRTLFV